MMKFSNKAIRILGSRNNEKVGNVGTCFTGNPVKIKDREQLNEFPCLYYVVLGWHLGNRYFKVIEEITL